MQTSFSLQSLANSDMLQSEKIIRACVHCGFCTATCPTYLLTGDELDSPRGRIYLIKEMFEHETAASLSATKHIDRCLSCLSCMTTCPSNVHYMHLVDHARAYIESSSPRPWPEMFVRALLAYVLPHPNLFRISLSIARRLKPVKRFLPEQFRLLFTHLPDKALLKSHVDRPQIFPAEGLKRLRVALLSGCVQTVLDTRINESTVRLLTRLGVEVVVVKGVGCCGAVAHHLGKTAQSHGFARQNIEAWSREIDGAGLDHIVFNASGCGTTVKDYGFLFRDDPLLRLKAAKISELAVDVSELVSQLGFARVFEPQMLRVAYHSACSLQHGQKIVEEPIVLLSNAGFDVVAVPEGHICCGSAGTFNLLQVELSEQLRKRKLSNIATIKPEVIACGNMGCMLQISKGSSIPVVHTVELLDWASGGPKPAALES